MNDKEALLKEWNALDYNGNGHVSLAEIDRWIQNSFPILNNKPAMMRAYKNTTHGGNDYVEKNEFISLLRNLFVYNRLWEVFQAIDTGNDRRIDLDEFKSGIGQLGLTYSEEEVLNEFKSIDANGGGQILFAEFCSWVAKKKFPID